MRLDSFSNTNNTEPSWTEATSVISTIQRSFNNFINTVTSLVNNFTGVKNSSSECDWKSRDAFSYSSQPLKFPVELRKVSSLSSDGMTLTNQSAPELARSTSVKSESAISKKPELARSTSVKSESTILNEKQQKTGFNDFFKFSMSTFWQKNVSSTNDSVDQNKVAATKIAEVAKACVEKACVEEAMHTGIGEICANLNQHINNKHVEGIFRGEPNKTIYNKDDNSKLIKAFSTPELQSEPIALAWMVKTYLGEFFPKVTMDELDKIMPMDKSAPEAVQQLDQVVAQEEFKHLMDDKINTITSEKIQNNLKACFATMAEGLRLIEREPDIQGLTKSSIVTSMLPRVIDITTLTPENLMSYSAKTNIITDLMVNYLTSHD
ncbi:hypothetical protein [Arsenophonus nasoniae]|uniref:Uncharacterized protein n=1 Tax=Arsenophonus nasoniae TaxID=638 RepID=A0AA95G9A1_9GAMM|nr:hypothetical protein [Arsenophonus nasoniae]WGL94332.1 hypothetical protein QE207_11360 [Arsenophonus nasoniae]